MADLSNTSFIPKQNPTKIKRQTVTRQVYFLTFISYVLIIAALIATITIFFYERHSKNTLASEISGLNSDIASFKQSDMDLVTDLDQRLIATSKVVKSNISMPAVLAVLEGSTISSMQFLDTTITRGTDNSILLKAKILTDSFDSVLFQREVYKKAQTLAGVELTDVSITLPNANGETAGDKVPMSVDFSATFIVPEGGVLYVPETTAPSNVIPMMPNSTTTNPAPGAAGIPESMRAPAQPPAPTTPVPPRDPNLPPPLPPIPPTNGL